MIANKVLYLHNEARDFQIRSNITFIYKQAWVILVYRIDYLSNIKCGPGGVVGDYNVR